MIIAMSLIALIREFDPGAADAIESFWNGPPKKETKKNIFEKRGGDTMDTQDAKPEAEQEKEPDNAEG